MTYLEKIKNRIKKFKNGKVFITNDFLDIAKNETVRRTLNQLVSENKIKRIINGFYYSPRYNTLINEYEKVYMPELAVAIARKYNWNIAPYNSTALNILGISTQVSTHYTYISSGRYIKYKVDDTILEFKRVNLSEIANMSLKTATVIQAIKSLGIENISDEIIMKIKHNLSETEKKELLQSISVSAWIYDVIKKICEE